MLYFWLLNWRVFGANSENTDMLRTYTRAYFPRWRASTKRRHAINHLAGYLDCWVDRANACARARARLSWYFSYEEGEGSLPINEGTQKLANKTYSIFKTSNIYIYICCKLTFYNSNRSDFFRLINFFSFSVQRLPEYSKLNNYWTRLHFFSI